MEPRLPVTKVDAPPGVAPKPSTTKRVYTRNELLAYRDLIQPIGIKSQEETDSQILVLSSAALGLSCTLYKDVLDKRIPAYGWLLEAAWICWLLAICCVVFSMYLSAETVRSTVKKIDLDLKANQEEKLEWDAPAAIGWRRPALVVVNYVSLASFLAGVFSFALLFLLNINAGHH
jgi:hypothetical protein